MLEREIMTYRSLQWLADDEDVGASSRAMAFCACGLIRFRKSHPWDPADFIRCMKLLRREPEIRKYFHVMAEMSPEWREFIKDWDRIEHQVIAELGSLEEPISNTAPLSYAMIQDVLERAKVDNNNV